jgi:hypothetical protein
MVTSPKDSYEHSGDPVRVKQHHLHGDPDRWVVEQDMPNGVPFEKVVLARQVKVRTRIALVKQELLPEIPE